MWERSGNFGWDQDAAEKRGPARRHPQVVGKRSPLQERDAPRLPIRRKWERNLRKRKT